MFLIVFSFVSSKLNKNSFLSLDRTMDQGFGNAMGTAGLRERRVCSFDRDQISGTLQSFVRTSSLFFRL